METACSSTERRGPGRRVSVLRTWPVWWKSTGPRSTLPVHESRPRYQRHRLRSELPWERTSCPGACSQGRFELFLSPFILEEAAEVLGRKFAWAEERSSQALRALGGAATVIEPRRLAETIEGDHADNRILECALEASADYLVTGDRRHLLLIEGHQGARILNAPPVPVGAGRVNRPRRNTSSN